MRLGGVFIIPRQKSLTGLQSREAATAQEEGLWKPARIQTIDCALALLCSLFHSSSVTQITEWWVISYCSWVYWPWLEGSECPRVRSQSVLSLLPITFCPSSSQIHNPWTEEHWVAQHGCSQQQPAAEGGAAQGQQPLWPRWDRQAPGKVLISVTVYLMPSLYFMTITGLTCMRSYWEAAASSA